MGDEAYDPFDDINNEEFARARPINTVTPGQEYVITHFLQKVSQWRDSADGLFPMNTHVQYTDEGLKFQSILPRKFNNKEPRWIETMNKLIAKNMNPKFVYYGTMSLGYEVDVLRHTQSASPAKLEIVQKIQAQCTPKKDGQNNASNVQTTPTKRSSNPTHESPSKFMRKE